MTDTIPNLSDLEAARARIAPHIRQTPVMHVRGSEITDRLGALTQPISFKLELLQHAGSFKARGAFNNLLSRPVPDAGVAAASGGNHGAAVAYAAHQLGHSAHIFVPEISSPAKIAKIQDAKADVRIGGARYADALEACQTFQAETGAMGIHAYDSAITVAGQGTLALEWTEQAGSLDTVLIAVGGAGLISGLALGFGTNTRVVAVEPEGSRALNAALEADRRVDVSVDSIAADSLGARSIGDLNFAICRDGLAGSVLVPDEAISQAMALLWSRFKIAAEPGGAASLAALLSGAYQPEPDEQVGVLVCGGNVDLGLLEAQRAAAR